MKNVRPILVADMKARLDYLKDNEQDLENLKSKAETMGNDGRRSLRELRSLRRDARSIQADLDRIDDDTRKELSKHLTKKQLNEFKKIQKELRKEAQSRFR